MSEDKFLSLKYRLLESGFILLIAIALFLCAALVSYDIHDPAWSTTGKNLLVQNVTGRLGAWFSDLFLFTFGFVSYCFPVLILWLAILLLQDRLLLKPPVWSFRSITWIMRGLGGTLFLLGACGLSTLHLSFLGLGETLPGSRGGMIGEGLVWCCVPIFSVFGSTVLFIAGVLIGLTFSVGLSWLQCLDKLGRSCFFLTLYVLQGMLFLARKLRLLLVGLKKGGVWLWQKIQPLSRRSAARLTMPKIRAFGMASTMENISSALPGQSLAQAKKPSARSVSAFREKLKTNIQTNRKANIKTNINPNKQPLDYLPNLNLLTVPKPLDLKKQLPREALERLSQEVEARLLDFNIKVKVQAVYPGPVITRFELVLAPGLKASKITALAKDLARALSVVRVRVVEVIPGKAVVGLEIPNQHRELVYLQDILRSAEYAQADSVLTLGLGKDISGIPVVVDLAKMPHLLVCGTTGSGKSVGVNAMLLSLLYKASPDLVNKPILGADLGSLNPQQLYPE